VNPIGKRSCYDETKRFAEAATMVYRRKHGVNTGMVRIFNTYGPRMRLDDGRVVPNFCGQALRGQPITVYGTGKQTRSFCFVDDLVEGIMKLADSSEHDPVNIGNPDEYTIEDFAKFVIKAVPGTKSGIEYRPLLHDDDPKQRKPDITRARRILGWEPRVKLADGIGRTLEYFRSKL
jgi:dTDP-glucose 4,6-dehydratase